MKLKPNHFNMYRFKIYVSSLFVFMSCSSDPETDSSTTPIEEPEQSRPNIMLIIADDMGMDASPGFNFGTIKPNMPNLQNLINTGIRFNNLWSNPTCTPTRSTILTGKYGFRTAVTLVGDELSTSETSLQTYLDNNTGSSYNHAVIGKWHLSNNATHPNNMGINYYSGLLSGGVQSYWNWNLTVNGSTNPSTEYTTSKFTDLAIDWVESQTQPWFLWLAYNAPHTPFHLPPDNLHFQGSLPTDQASIDANPIPYYMAMLEALDTEFGRLLNSMSQEQKNNTIFIFIGDNGTPNQVVQEYNSFRAKGSVYQGGINVPMVIAGKNVTRINQTEDALINTTDLFATIADIAETGTTEINDSKSFKALLTDINGSKREYVYAEVGHETGGTDYTIRNESHKYIVFDDGSEALYNLNDYPLENPNLLSTNQFPLSDTDSAIMNELIAKLIEIRE
jgi:arylsulfatase A-like enzyme